MALTDSAHAKKLTVAILGHKNSGKTSVAETVISRLRDEGYKVASAKHVFVKGFSLDAKETDTYRHSKAGANPVISVSDVETAILIKDGVSKFTLDRLRSWTPDADVLVLEGFSRHALKDEDVAKIVCVRTMAEYEDLRSEAKGKILAFCSFEHLGNDILRIKEDSSILEYRVSEFIKGSHPKRHLERSKGRVSLLEL
jgi:molybdopterin-guanine dinucleotide biosynthesis protein B